ncbi:RNA-directed DNA polymerase, eukaryota, reverse transcriptase zinc-binding domain protein [Tanacetum coccineum]
MTTLKFADTHNMVAFLAKPAESEGFEQIVDFLNAIVKAKTVNGEVQLQALVDGKKIIITESIVRRDLQFAEGVDCLPNATIFEQLTLMGFPYTVKVTEHLMARIEDRLMLEDSVTMEEIWAAVWDCGSEKAPGPDGFSFLFVKRYWELLKDDILKKKKLLIFKVDFEKAYDSVSWLYLDHVLLNLGFGVKWRMWIKSCLESARTSVLVNGSPTSEFPIKRGLRQGDLLSQFLFIILMEGLHLALQEAVQAGFIRGSWIGSSEVRVSHLFYADDVVITTDWSMFDMEKIIRVLQLFFLASGLKINIHKSNVYGVGVSSDEINDMSHVIGCEACFFPFVYLRLPIGGNMNHTVNWKKLLDRFHDKLSTWQVSLLSSGGRLTLLKLILGGLRIGSLKTFNLALLQKWRWRLVINPDASWVRLMKSVHGEDTGFNQNGCKIKDIWATIVGDSSLESRYNRLFRLATNKDCRSRDRISNGEWTWDWSRQILGGHNLASFTNILLEIGNVQVSSSSDSYIWEISNDGNFSMGSTRRHIDDYSLPSMAPSTRWHKMLPRKVNVFMWRLILDRLPHRLNLSLHGMEIQDITCPICVGNVESNDHIFFSCDTAVQVWYRVRIWCDGVVPQLGSFSDWFEWLNNWPVLNGKRDRMYIICATMLWTLWRYRNNVVFNSQFMRRSDIFDCICLYSFSWIKYRGAKIHSWND